MRNSLKATLVSSLILTVGFSPVIAQTKKAQPKKAQTKETTKPAGTHATASAGAKNQMSSDGFTILPSGLEFKLIKHGDGTRKPQATDHTELYIHVHVDDSTIFDSRKMFSASKPVPVPISAPKFKGDPMEGFMMMVAGDSAIMRLSVDSMKKSGNQLMPWMKEGVGQKIEYDVQMVSVRTAEEEKKETEVKMSKQKTIDEGLLKEYFEKNNLKPAKTASGLYYTISKEGTGDYGKNGQLYSVFYTGKLLNGKTFDSNVDTAFHHPEAFSVPVGKGNVIKGWDEGLLLFKKGAKGTLYIPSGLAYGPQERGAQIPANSILVFDIEVTDIKDAPPAPKQVDPAEQAKEDDKILQDYFKKNNITATKTQSGLYYAVHTKGLGPNAKAGKKVTMNYTGKLLDGKTFDSNTDPKFNHVSPFTFTLGQGQVIKGWDEGVQLLNLGTKATFYIPSGLAYGSSGAGGSIPPNSVLVFDVEVAGID